MSSGSFCDTNRVCEALKNVNVDLEQHHLVTVNEAHYSKVHLGFSSEAWMKLLKNYILTRSDIQVDFSKCYTGYPHCEPYCAMYLNLETYHSCLVDIECALRDFLKERNYHRVQYNDVTDARITIGVTNYNTWIYMLRKYMCKYHPDIELKWCKHSLHPHEYCECEIDQRDNIEIDVLKMMCDHHSNRTW
jgi:hypothetical protein